MRNKIIICTIIFYSVSVSLFVILKYLQRKKKESLNGVGNYTFDSLQNVFISSTRLLSCSLEYGKFWSFDLKKNTVYIPCQSRYSIYDQFVLLHETGHFMDSKTKYRTIYRVDYLLRIFNILFYFPMILISILRLKNNYDQETSVLLIVCSAYVVILFAELCITAWTEVRASRWAVSHVDAGIYEKELRKASFFAVSDQLLIKLMWMFPLLELIYVFMQR